jgi:two-component system, NarL family, response regulator LiaR
MATIHILLAEDHILVRESLKQYIEKEPDLEVIGEAGDGEAMVKLASELAPDLIIADISMPKLNGIEATKQIKERNLHIPVLILTAYDLDQYVFPVLEAGAAGYLLKDISGQDLIESIHRVYRGDSVLHPAIMRKVMQRFRGASTSGHATPTLDLLTEREVEVLTLAAGGKSNKEIAETLQVSVRTVEAHLGHIFTKLDVSSRTEAVILALRRGWVGLDQFDDIG